MEQGLKKLKKSKGINLTAKNSYGETDYTQTAANFREYEEEQRSDNLRWILKKAYWITL